MTHNAIPQVLLVVALVLLAKAAWHLWQAGRRERP